MLLLLTMIDGLSTSKKYSTHYASEKPNFEVISRGTFEGLGWFSEGPNGQTYLLLDNWFQKWPKKSNYH